jgi:altronate dehydratase
MNSLDLEVGNTYKFTYVAKCHGSEKLVWKIATVENVSDKWIKTNKWFVPTQSIVMIEEMSSL